MIEALVRKNLLAIVSEYRRATGKTLSEVSRDFYGKGNFLSKFKAGDHSISVRKLDLMLAKFHKEWPDNARWPFLSAIFMDRDVPK